MSVFHHSHRNTGGRYTDEVIIGGSVYSVSRLRSKARRLTMRMWASVAVTLLIAMTIVPYLAQAATNGNNSDAFSGTVIPGYSMGGVSVTAYGVDINSWGTGRSDSGSMAKSNYGIWSGSRVSNASSNDGTSATSMTSDAKSSGWRSITGRQNYSVTNPNGQDTSSTATDTVNPYRTASDSTYWDAQTASASATNAGITVSWLPEFICVGVGSDGQATVLTNPDDATSIASNQSMILKQDGSGYTTQVSSAIPHYISLKDLFDAYGLDKSSNTMTDLKNAMQSNKAPLNSLLDDSHNLLYGTSYSDLNGSTGESSDAFNPYPYTMVFTKTDNGKQVVSGIYENCEAYVYFSPQSMYQAYTTLEQEYESIVSANSDSIGSASDGSVSDASLILTLGYYQAAMSICEAYLSEALPQDMTRGYVGPAEPSSVNGSSTSSNGGNWRSDMSDGITLSGSPTESASFKNYTYATIMYDVANWLVSQGTDGSAYCLAQTNATMDTLSTFGYNVNDDGIGTGVMKGMNAAQTYNRMTAFTAYSSNIQSDTSGIDDASYKSIDESALKDQKNTGLYIAPYYPIQQHCIPSSQASYRFSIITAVPSQTIKAYLSAFGFGAGTSGLSYTTGQFDTSANAGNYSSLPTDTDIERLNTLIGMFQDGSNDDTDASVTGNADYILNNTNYQADVSMVLHPENADGTSSSSSDSSDSLSAQQRVDQALMNYDNSSMTADNVHDLCDVIRSISGLKYETFMRFYNPLKSSGSPTDVYLTRVSPANNSYMPTVLLAGYSAAGGADITNGNERTDTAAYDYFSIPSFAPCFAQHTATDCYYGSLNYELRAFLQTGFLSTLDTGTGGLNIPAVEAMNQVKQQTEQMSDNEVINADTMKKNITTLYLAAQLYSYLKTFYEAQDGDIRVQVNTLVSYVNNATVNGGADAEAAAVGQSTDYASMPWKDNFDKLRGNDGNTDVLTMQPQNGPTFTFFSDLGADWLGNSGAWKSVKVFNYVASPGDDVMDKLNGTVTDVSSSDDNHYSDADAFKDNSIRDLIFSYEYRQTLLSLIGPSGDYYWGIDLTDNGSGRGTLASYTGVNTIFSNATNVSSKMDDVNILANNIGAMFSGDHLDTTTAKSKMDEAAAALFTEVNQFYEALGDLSSATPTQMQNAIAWADYQDASSSQNAYQSDPSQATTTVVVNNGNNSIDSSKANAQVTNIRTARKLSTDWDDQGGLSGTAQSNTLQSKTTRGVEGTTSTNTGNPAAYTTTAMLSRIRDMNQQSVTYPYSGLATSSLSEGINRYLQMQSHVADYSSIANKLNNDLANWQTTSAVTLEWGGSDSNLLDFDILGQVQEFIASMSGSLVQIAGNLFTSQMFPNENASTTQKFAGTSVSGAAVQSVIQSTGDGNSYTAALSASTPNATRQMLSTSCGSSLGTMSSTAAADDSSNDGNSHTGIVGNNVGTASVNFILNTDVGKNVYKFLQSLALVFVLVSLIVIAFQNMLVYTNGTSTDFISAQTTLKQVLPRAVLAVFMIGLPPIGNGTGFQGGGFLLLEAVNSIVRQIGSVFSSIEGTGIVDMTIKAFQSNEAGFFGIIITLGLALIIFIAYLIGAAFVFIINLFLFLFFLLSPLAWAAYVWPFDGNVNDDGTIYGTIFQRITRRLGSKTFTGSKVGNEAAAGFVGTFIDVEIVYLIYVLMLWFVSYIFVGTAGDQWLKDTNTSNAHTSIASLVFLTVLNCGVIYAMGKLLMDEFHNTNAMSGMRNVANGIFNGIKRGTELAKGAGTVLQAVNTAHQLGNAAATGMPVDGVDTKDALSKINASELGSVAGDNNADFAKKALRDAANALNGDGVATAATTANAQEAAVAAALPKSESGAVLVHADNSDKKEEKPQSVGQRLGSNLKQLGRGLLDGDSAAVGMALGDVRSMVGSTAKTAALNRLADSAYAIGAGATPIAIGKYALGAARDVSGAWAHELHDKHVAANEARSNGLDAHAAKMGVKAAYAQLNGKAPSLDASPDMSGSLQKLQNEHMMNVAALEARAQDEYAGKDKLSSADLQDERTRENVRYADAVDALNAQQRAIYANVRAEQQSLINSGNVTANMARDEHGKQINGGEQITDAMERNAYDIGYDQAVNTLNERMDRRATKEANEAASNANHATVKAKATPEEIAQHRSEMLQNGGLSARAASGKASIDASAALTAQRRDTDMAVVRDAIAAQVDEDEQRAKQRRLNRQSRQQTTALDSPTNAKSSQGKNASKSNDAVAVKNARRQMKATRQAIRDAKGASKKTEEGKNANKQTAEEQRREQLDFDYLDGVTAPPKYRDSTKQLGNKPNDAL